MEMGKNMGVLLEIFSHCVWLKVTEKWEMAGGEFENRISQ